MRLPGQPSDLVNVGRVTLGDEAPGIGGDGLEEPPLGFGEDRAERERRLARTGHPGEGDNAPTGNIDVDIAEVVLAGATDADETGVVGIRGGGAGVLLEGRHRLHPRRGPDAGRGH